MSTQVEMLWPHRIAIALACVTFPLIWVGGLVTTYQAGMAVPDWPGTYGYNLFLYPWTTWLAGPFDLFIEHGHRLLGGTAGLLTIAFGIAVFRCEKRRWMRRMAIAAIVGVCLQGALGGIRVLLDARTLAMLHGCLGPAFFAFTFALVAVTGSSWQAVKSACDPLAHKLQQLALFTTCLMLFQLVLGAQLRHTPIDAGLYFVVAMVCFHLLFAAALVLYSLLIAVAALQLQSARRQFVPPAMGLLALVLSQVSLGAATWVVKYGWPRWVGDYEFTAAYVVRREAFVSSLIVTAHVAIGSLILAMALLLTLQSFRFLHRFVPQLAEVGR